MPEKKDLIPLRQASQICDYSQEYLSLRARQGKLKAVKEKGKWMTTKEWLSGYIDKVKRRKSKVKADTLEQKVDRFFNGPKTSQSLPVADFSDIEKEIEKIAINAKETNRSLRAGIATTLFAVILLTAGIFSAKKDISRIFAETDRKVVSIGEAGEELVSSSAESVKQVSEDMVLVQEAVVSNRDYTASVFRSFGEWVTEETNGVGEYIYNKGKEGLGDLKRGTDTIIKDASRFFLP